MILLDPDLEPDPAPKTNSVKRAGALAQTRKSKTNSRDVRLPSARTLARFLQAAQAAVRLRGQVTVLLTTDAAIRKLNRQFRGKNKATDVLSFPAAGLGAEGMAGDLAISVTTAMGQAAEQGHSLGVEIKVLVLHGLLHLAGFDHEVDDGRMARREKALRAKLGLPLGLIERAGFPTLSPEKRRKDGAREIGGGSGKRDTKRRPSGAKARVHSASVLRGLKPPPPSVSDSAVVIVGVKTPTYQPRSAAKGGRV
jgi:probable rRNA maturation factor